MTKAAAMQAFWESFGLPAYEENSVPRDAAFPRITYQFISDSFGHPVFFSASLWYRGTSNVAINAKAEEISSSIGRGGVRKLCDGGMIWIQKGNPFAQFAAGDPDDKTIKRKLLNLTAVYITAN